ncbi:MAG: DMT family transporter [Candidatus Brocadiia bacterium]
MTDAHMGEIVALITVFCWTATALAFEAAGRRVGSLAVNVIRIGMALVFITAFCAIWRGPALWLPFDASPHALLWLSLSGFVGFALGDLFYFRALVTLGSRMATLIMLTLAPPLAALFGMLWLDEHLTLLQWGGMAATIVGVAFVVSERRNGENGVSISGVGIIFGVLGALGQAGGAVLGKLARADIDAVGATQIRVIAGVAGLFLVATVIGWWPKVIAAFRDRIAVAQMTGGALFGPFLGVLLFQVAIWMTDVGVVQTIAALVPIVIIPIAVYAKKEKVTLRAVLGSVIAVGGVALLFTS